MELIDENKVRDLEKRAKALRYEADSYDEKARAHAAKARSLERSKESVEWLEGRISEHEKREKECRASAKASRSELAKVSKMLEREKGRPSNYDDALMGMIDEADDPR
ncbi:MAG: hypothetical protein PHR15_04770 [Atopobiaceae bacterium]|jgi:superfamily II DNA or RNA helicase|nr:hypothetical protein [Atopobiaceae bacterium]MCH4214976.1 hypothetical protein [Atopobiaceae bacterium]MCH4276986.1 hypothetical protein [Atopobiaceae bacterium]MCI1226894.1 hypothetical protein [Atopobiaceae bacterium]MCI1259274.1 hypothetical protein [Atopobiaceae bacterium]